MAKHLRKFLAEFAKYLILFSVFTTFYLLAMMLVTHVWGEMAWYFIIVACFCFALFDVTKKDESNDLDSTSRHENM